MALPGSGQISMNQVNVELGLSGTTQISLNQSSVRTLFQRASGQISMSDGWGKSAVSPPSWTNGGGGSTEHRCEWESFGACLNVTGNGPFTVEFIMYANGCSSPYTIYSQSQGSAQYYNSFQVCADNWAASNYGSYTGGTAYKAAHYKMKVSNSAGEIYSGAWSVTYGYCDTQTTCPCGEDCTENCCDVDCSGDCITGYLCRGDCSWSDYENCINNGCNCWPSACGYDCSCWCGYDTTTVYQYDTYSPNGSCT